MCKSVQRNRTKKPAFIHNCMKSSAHQHHCLIRLTAFLSHATILFFIVNMKLPIEIISSFFPPFSNNILQKSYSRILRFLPSSERAVHMPEQVEIEKTIIIDIFHHMKGLFHIKEKR